MAGLGSIGRIEKQMNDAGLQDMKQAVMDIAKQMTASNRGGGSVLTAYSDDDAAVWKSLRRELVKGSIAPSGIIRKKMPLIKKFILELGEKGVLDQPQDDEEELTSSSQPSKDNADDTSDSGSSTGVHLMRDPDGDFLSDDSTKAVFYERPTHSPTKQSTHSTGQATSSADILQDGFESKLPVYEDASSERTSQQSENLRPDHDRQDLDTSTGSDHSSRTLRLTVENLRPLQSLHSMPKFILALRRSDFVSFPYDAVLPETYFLATPWGICLIVDGVNVSELLEEFKIIMQDLTNCLSNTDSIDATRSGMTRQDRNAIGDEMARAMVFATTGEAVMHQLAYPHSSSACQPNPNTQTNSWLLSMPGATTIWNAVAFCDQYIQRLYDAGRMSRRESAHYLETVLSRWFDDFDNDVNECIVNFWGPSGRTIYWVTNSYAADPVPQVAIDEVTLEIISAETIHETLAKRPLMLLAETMWRYQRDIYTEARAYLVDPPLDHHARWKESKRLYEYIFQSVLTELDNVEGDS